MSTISGEQFEELTKEACNPSRTERFSCEHLVEMENYMEQFPTGYVYTHRISVNEPFTEKVRKSMTENVKMLAHATLLGRNDNENIGSNDGKFASEDEQIYNFARDDVYKNASATKPAKLNKLFAEYLGSIGQVSCGGSPLGTCFLVTQKLVITNYHVYNMIMNIKNAASSNPPIIISFDYFDFRQAENIFNVEVDEQYLSTSYENEHLDYKFFWLRPNSGLQSRVPLGQMVKNFQLDDGRVVILGHPGGNEMQEEVCIVVGYHRFGERMKSRHEQFTGVHMTNAELLFNPRIESIYQNHLSYDTSFFSGSSGSPVFDMNGNIVAMHTQGYTLHRMEFDNAIQEQVVKKYSLMEFGIQFFKICQHMKQLYGESRVREIFPHCDETPMNQT